MTALMLVNFFQSVLCVYSYSPLLLALQLRESFSADAYKCWCGSR